MNKRILSTLLALCMMLALLPGTALAENVAFGTCGKTAKWSLSSEGTLTISGTGVVDDCNYGTAPWFGRRSEIKKVVISSGITQVRARNFTQLNNLVSVSIPASVEYLGWNTFEGNPKLTSIQYGGSVEQWNEIDIDATNYHDLFTPDCVTTYAGSPGTAVIHGGRCGTNATWTLDRNGTMTIGGKGVVNDCNYGTAPWYAVRSEIKKVVINNGITQVRARNFTQLNNMVSVFIPVSVEYLGWNTFEGNPKLRTIYYGGSESQWTDIEIDKTNNSTIYSSDVTIIANYVDTCTVTLNPNGGTVSKRSITVTPGRTYSGLPTPTRSGYTFSGWYTASSGGARVTASTTVTNSSNHTLYAHWTKSTASKTYTITLNANSGKVSPSSIKVSANKTYLSSLPTPTRSGYTFSGWYTSRTGGTKITSTTKATANRTIYAHWAKDTAPKTYLITFDPNGGSVFTRYAAVVNGGTYRSLPTPSYPGRHFAGWYTASSGGTKVTPQTKVSLTGNRTLYAHWTTSPVSVRSMESGSWRVTVPAGSRLALYGSETSAAQATSATISRDTALTCTRMAVLSNGTVRYYAKINSGSSYWFCYSDEMAVN